MAEPAETALDHLQNNDDDHHDQPEDSFNDTRDHDRGSMGRRYHSEGRYARDNGGRRGEVDRDSLREHTYVTSGGPPPHRLQSAGLAPTAAGNNKRSADGESLQEQPEAKKRNRRLFGALLGTLKKAKEEEALIKDSVVQQRREEMLQKAEQRKTEESERIRREAAELAERKRIEQEEKRQEETLIMEIARLQTSYQERLKRHEDRSLHIRTKTEESYELYWTPAKLSKQTRVVLHQQKKEFYSWRSKQRKDFKAEMQALQDRAAGLFGQQQQQQDQQQNQTHRTEALAIGDTNVGTDMKEQAQDKVAEDAAVIEKNQQEAIGGDVQMDEDQVAPAPAPAPAQLIPGNEQEMNE